jgi:hypothetical protein
MDVLIYILEHTILPQRAADRTEWQFAVVMVALAIASILSVIGCFVIIIGFSVTKQLNLFQNRLIFYLSISDLIKSISNLMIPVRYIIQYFFPVLQAPMCQIEGYFQEYTISTFLMTWCVATAMLLKAGIGIKHPAPWFEPLSILIGFVLPALWGLVLGATGHYGNAGYWCWIKSELCGICDLSTVSCYMEGKFAYDPQMRHLGETSLQVPSCIPYSITGRFFSFYAILIFVMVWILAVYGFVAAKMYYSYKRSGAMYLNTSRRRYFFRLSLYALAFVFIRAPSIIERGFQAFFPGYSIFVWALFQGFCSSIQGFANALIYGMHEGFIGKIKAMCCGKCLQQEGDTIHDLPDFDTDNTLVNPLKTCDDRLDKLFEELDDLMVDEAVESKIAD